MGDNPQDDKIFLDLPQKISGISRKAVVPNKANTNLISRG
jgi:hypothetical protein